MRPPPPFVASTAVEGLAGARDGLKLLKGMLETHWDHLHPQLDPDDNNDPLERINLLSQLAAVPGPDWNPGLPQRVLRSAPLASSRQLGSFSLRDVLMATGEIKASDGDTPPDMALIEGAFSDTDPDELERVGTAASECVKLSKEIDDWITTRVGVGNAADLRAWHDAVKAVDNRLRDQLTRRGLGEGASDNAADEVPVESVDGSTPDTAAVTKLSGAIRSRDDVVTALNKVLDYYTRYEPSSPVPVLVRRVQRLVPMGFAEVIRELAPAAMDQIKQIAGEDPFGAAPVVASSSGATTTPVASPPPSDGGQAKPTDKFETKKISF